MKIETTMKTDFFQVLQTLGISWQNLVNGLIGGLVWSVYKRSKFYVALRQIFIGGIVSAYVTPFVASKTNLPATGFLSFVIGMIGMVVLDTLYNWAVKKIKLFL